MSDVDPQVRGILLVMGVCSGVAQAFVVEATKRGWDLPDSERTAEAFSVAGPMMLTGLPERELVEKLEDPLPNLFFQALAYCQDSQLDGKSYPRGASRLPAWVYHHIHGRHPELPKDRDFLELIERYFGVEELHQLIAQISKQTR